MTVRGVAGMNADGFTAISGVGLGLRRLGCWCKRFPIGVGNDTEEGWEIVEKVGRWCDEIASLRSQ